MFNWNSLLDESAIASVLSGGYERFAQPVREGLITFLEGLPARHQEEIVARQAALPFSASISQRLALLARCCPALHKLGQILARDHRLAPELREHLRELESFPSTMSEQTIRDTLARELGSLEECGVRLEFPALAEASVAVVVPFSQLDTAGSARGNDRGLPQNGVFKILRPGIVDRLELELDLLTKVGSHLDDRCHALGLPHLDYEDSFQQIQEKLRSEVRLDEEQKHLSQAAEFYADEPRVHIPALLDHCTPRVTAMERIIGVKITDHQIVRSLDRRRLADLLVRALVAQPFFSRASRAMFHSDPHAGNLFFTHDHRLAILDWSLVGWLGSREQIAVVNILQAAVSLDAQRMVDVLTGLAERLAPNHEPISSVVQSRLDQIRQGQFPGFDWLVGLLDAAVQSAGLRFATDLMLLRKSLHTLEGVLLEMGAHKSQLDRTLLTQFVSHFAAEWPQRWFASPVSRNFATHLSNADLGRILMNYPSTIARYWLGNSFDLLDANRSTGKLHTVNLSLEAC